MKVKEFVVRFFVTFGIALMASILVTLCWNYLIDGKGLIVDWETSSRTALILAIVIPLTHVKKKKIEFEEGLQKDDKLGAMHEKTGKNDS
jgi:hypothetical protein